MGGETVKASRKRGWVSVSDGIRAKWFSPTAHPAPLCHGEKEYRDVPGFVDGNWVWRWFFFLVIAGEMYSGCRECSGMVGLRMLTARRG